MKCLRLKAACAVALMLLSLVVNTNAYGNSRLLTRMYERTVGEVAKLPQRFMGSALPKKLAKGAAVLAVLCGAYVCGTDDVSIAQPQHIERTAEASSSHEVVVFADKKVNPQDLSYLIEELEIIKKVRSGDTIEYLENMLDQTLLTSTDGQAVTFYNLPQTTFTQNIQKVMVKVGDEVRMFSYWQMKNALWHQNRDKYGDSYGGLMSPSKAQLVAVLVLAASAVASLGIIIFFAMDYYSESYYILLGVTPFAVGVVAAIVLPDMLSTVVFPLEP